MHVEFLVEELSMERFLDHVAPRLLPAGTTWKPITFRGKPDLLRNLPGRLRGYSYRTDEDLGIVVLVDEDREDCRTLKAELEQAAREASLPTQSTARQFRVLNRIVVEELEAWFFGDVEALRSAYPRLPVTLARRRAYRAPDAVAGGTAEALERLLKQHGYHLSGMPKAAVAAGVGTHLLPTRNISPSFQVFVQGLQRLVESLQARDEMGGICA